MRRVSLLLALTLTLCACAKSEALIPETDQEITEPSGSTAAITFLKTGTYEIYCYLSVNGVLLTTLWFEAFVMP